MTTPHADRLRAAAAAAAESGIDALLLTPGADLRYLVGYDAQPLERLTCLTVPASGDPFLVVPLLELPAANDSGAGESVRIVTHAETDDAFTTTAGLLRDALGHSPTVLGVADHMWAEQVLRWESTLPDVAVRLAGEVLRPLRLRKSAAEVDELRRAGQAIDRVHRQMGDWLRPGRTEREVGRDIAEAILAEGHATASFVIVGSGPNAASPHHSLSDRVIEAGDPVVIDIGGELPSGYCSDCSRTYVAGGNAPSDFVTYYDVLLDAQKAACDSVRPGVSAESVDAVARDLITAAGYGDLFVHRTGHGIGLEVHEDPYIVAGNGVTLEPGMCFSVEPGIYRPGRHGARIEDIVTVTADGVERLNVSERELAILGS